MDPFESLVVAVAYDRLCSFEMGVATELFGLDRPELDCDWYRFEVVSADEPPLRTIGGTMWAPTDLTVLERAGTIVLPGWRDIDEAPPAELVDAIRTGHDNGARVMSICSGVFVLAATGLLDGLAATTHWRYTDRLAEQFPAIEVRPEVLYVDNGSTLTSAGSAAGIDLGLHLIARDHGAHVANQVAKRLVVLPHREGGQAQFIDTPHHEAPVAALAPIVSWALEHLDQPLPVGVLAGRAAMAPRTFARRFAREMGTPPHQWITRQRVAAARRTLETTDLPIDQVAARCGFGSSATLRHHFQQELQTTPTSYRRTFRLCAASPSLAGPSDAASPGRDAGRRRGRAIR